MSNEVQRVQPDPIKQRLTFRFLRRLGFRIDKTVLNLWGPPDHYALLKNHIARTKQIDPLIVGHVKGLKRTVLVDGITRLVIQHELSVEGIEVPYKINVREYDSYGEMIREVVTIQHARRNITPAQVALAILEAEKINRGGIIVRGRGRPKAGAPAFPSAR